MRLLLFVITKDTCCSKLKIKKRVINKLYSCNCESWIYYESVWIGLNLTFVFCLAFSLLFFLFSFLIQPHYMTKSTVNSARMHRSWVPQISLFSHFFIKNGSHSIIHTFKNYFAIVFSVSVKISLIQTDPIRIIPRCGTHLWVSQV